MGLDIKTLAAAKAYVKSIINGLNNFSGSYKDLKDKPDVYTKGESYNKSEVDTALNGKRNTADNIPWAEVSGKPDTYPPSLHTHNDSDIVSISANKITGILNLDQIPASAQERLVKVKDEDEMLQLTIADVQNGDSVKVIDGDKLYHVVDDTKLDSMDGYISFTSGVASSVYWDSVLGKPDLCTRTETDSIASAAADKRCEMSTEDVILGTSWVGSAAPYTQTIAVDGVTASANVFVFPNPGINVTQFRALGRANILGGTQSVNSIQLIAMGVKPAIDIPLRCVIIKNS